MGASGQQQRVGQHKVRRGWRRKGVVQWVFQWPPSRGQKAAPLLPPSSLTPPSGYRFSLVPRGSAHSLTLPPLVPTSLISPPPPIPPTPRLGTIDYLAPEILGCPVKSHPMEFKDNPEVGYTYKASGVVCFMAWGLGYRV